MAGVNVPKLALAAVETRTIGAGLLSIPLERLERCFGASVVGVGLVAGDGEFFVMVGLMACMGEGELLEAGFGTALALTATASNEMAFFVDAGEAAFCLVLAKATAAFLGATGVAFLGDVVAAVLMDFLLSGFGVVLVGDLPFGNWVADFNGIALVAFEVLAGGASGVFFIEAFWAADVLPEDFLVL